MPSNWVVASEELRQELAAVRRCGVAVVRHGWHSEVAAVAAPVRDQTGQVVAAGGVSGSLTRFTDEAADKARVFIPRVGPMTVTMALRNTLRLYRSLQHTS